MFLIRPDLSPDLLPEMLAVATKQAPICKSVHVRWCCAKLDHFLHFPKLLNNTNFSVTCFMQLCPMCSVPGHARLSPKETSHGTYTSSPKASFHVGHMLLGSIRRIVDRDHSVPRSVVQQYMEDVTAELPIFAFIFTKKFRPKIIGSASG